MPLAAVLRHAGIDMETDCDKLWEFFAARIEREKDTCLAILREETIDLYADKKCYEQS